MHSHTATFVHSSTCDLSRSVCGCLYDPESGLINANLINERTVGLAGTAGSSSRSSMGRQCFALRRKGIGDGSSPRKAISGKVL